MKPSVITSIVTVVLALCAHEAGAQNVQFHYDMGRDAATTTVEMFKADNAGSTFFFVDLDYNEKNSHLSTLKPCQQIFSCLVLGQQNMNKVYQ